MSGEGGRWPLTSWQALENTGQSKMGDKTVIEQQGYRKYIHSRGLRQVFPAPMSTIAEEMAETLGLTTQARYYGGSDRETGP